MGKIFAQLRITHKLASDEMTVVSHHHKHKASWRLADSYLCAGVRKGITAGCSDVMTSRTRCIISVSSQTNSTKITGVILWILSTNLMVRGDQAFLELLLWARRDLPSLYLTKAYSNLWNWKSLARKSLQTLRSEGDIVFIPEYVGIKMTLLIRI